MAQQYKSNPSNVISKATLCISIVFFFSLCAQSQERLLSFDSIRLDQVLITLEAQTDYSFNYDPAILAEYTYTGKISRDITELELSNLFYATALAYELTEQTVVIYMPDFTIQRICGYIKDSSTNEALAYANIYVSGTDNGTQSDLNGYFDIEVTAHKNQPISISYIGYESQELMFQEFEEKDCSSILLRRDLNLWSSDIIITDYVIPGITEGEAFNGYIMKFSELSDDHSSVEHDILKTTQLIPGIISTDESATNLTIRGSTNSQNLLMWEGATLYQSGHLFGMISALNPFVIDNVNINKGSYDPRYDNRVGGVIDISLTDSIGRHRRSSARGK